ncbi:SDR family oxidoreductase [Oerskovia sp. M15]
MTEVATWDALLQEVRPDVVVHLAAETGTGQSLAESSRHATVNVVGTSQMLDALQRHGALPGRLVLTSSRAVYGEGAWRRDEDGSVFYPGLRARAMLERQQWDFEGAEPSAMKAAEVFPNRRASTPRPSSLRRTSFVCGPTLTVSTPGSFACRTSTGQGSPCPTPTRASCRCSAGSRVAGVDPLYEDGEVRRDFVLIDDVADAVVRASTAPDVGSDPIDIGAGETQTIRYAAELIAARYGAPAPHVTGSSETATSVTPGRTSRLRRRGSAGSHASRWRQGSRGSRPGSTSSPESSEGCRPQVAGTTWRALVRRTPSSQGRRASGLLGARLTARITGRSTRNQLNVARATAGGIDTRMCGRTPCSCTPSCDASCCTGNA